MKSRVLGSQGPELTVLGFGTWVLAGPYRFGWGPVDDDESVSAIRRAVEAGVNWIDTAATYASGRSEEVVGRAIQPFSAGEDVLVFTKCGRPWRGGEVYYDLRPASIREVCEASLERLGVEQEGKVRWIGVCNFDVPLRERCEAIRHVDSAQPPLSLLKRHAQELIRWCREHRAGVIGYSPMGSGLLTGSFNREGLDRLAEDDWRRRAPAFQEPKLSQNLALVERLETLAERLGTNVASLAVAWALAVPGVTGAIVGARRPAQVDDWLGAGNLELDQTTLDEIERALAETGAGKNEPEQPPPVA